MSREQLVDIVAQGKNLCEVNLGVDFREKMDATEKNLAYGNLRDLALVGARLRRAELKGADFESSNLQDADFGYARLQGANFTNTNLKNARFEFATLKDAVFKEADLQHAYFSFSDLRGIDISGANLQKVRIKDTYLKGVEFLNMDLREANFEHSILEGVKFDKSNLEGSDFRKAILKDVSFFGAKLQNSDLTFTNLKKVEFYKSNLQGVDFSDAELQDVSLAAVNLQRVSFRYSRSQNTSFNSSDMKFSDFSNSYLQGSTFIRSKLQGAKFVNTKFSCPEEKENFSLGRSECSQVDVSVAVFYGEICSNRVGNNTNCKQYTANFRGATGLNTLKYRYSRKDARPIGINKVRAELREAGSEREARELTYFIKHGEIEEALQQKNRPWGDRFDALFSRVALEWTVRWGMEPGRALILLINLIGIMSLVYWLLLVGVWKKKNILSGSNLLRVIPVPSNLNHGGSIFEKLEEGKTFEHSFIEEMSYGIPDYGYGRYPLKDYLALYRCALWFSILSAFHFGWRDLNVGNWLARLQPKPFTYKPQGLIRFLSGFHSLLSIYLLALWALTYFGAPWG